MSDETSDKMSDDGQDDATTSNPLPPPPRPPSSRTQGEERDEKEGPPRFPPSLAQEQRFANLSNDDFRKMVMDTPRRGDVRGKLKSSRLRRPEEEIEESPEKKALRKLRLKTKEEEEKLDDLGGAYRDRAKERREDQNPDYDPAISELGSLHAVAPPGTTDLRTSDAHRISIENSKFLGGDVEHTHLVKGLDYALLQKVRSELDKKKDDDDEDFGDDKKERLKEEKSMIFRSALGKSVYQWTVKLHRPTKANEMFLPGRTVFMFDMDEEFAHEIPTTVHRSKADCPAPQETLVAGVDGLVLDRISKIMSYLRMGGSGKVMKKKKKDKEKTILIPGISSLGTEEGMFDVGRPAAANGKVRSDPDEEGPAVSSLQPVDVSQKTQQAERIKEEDNEDIFEEAGRDYQVTKTMSRPEGSASPVSMDESPRDDEAAAAKQLSQADVQREHDQVATAGEGQGLTLLGTAGAAYPAEWQDWSQGAAGSEQAGIQWAADQTAGMRFKQEQYQQFGAPDAPVDAEEDLTLPGSMTQGEKDRGMGSVFKRDDQRLQRMRERDSREKDPNFISESYSECYPGYQEYTREVMDESGDEEDLTKMDMGAKAKGRLHRWDFDTEEEWSKYNEAKEAMPKAAFQFGVKMADGRKTRKNKDQKLNNELHRIQQIIKKKKDESSRTPAPSESPYAGGKFEESEMQHPGKRLKF